jgi:hypothetical protein
MNWSSINYVLMKNVYFLDQRKRVKMQWLHDSNQNNADNLNYVGREAIRHFRKKNKCLKAKID